MAGSFISNCTIVSEINDLLSQKYVRGLAFVHVGLVYDCSFIKSEQITLKYVIKALLQELMLNLLMADMLTTV